MVVIFFFDKKEIEMITQKSFISATLLLLTLCILVGMIGVFPCMAADTGITMEGAQIRTEGVQGLRFVAKIEKSKFELVMGENANFGILLIPQSSADIGEKITKDTEKVSVSPAKNTLTQEVVEKMDLIYDPDYVYFTAVLLEIPGEFYGTEILARAYVNNGGNYTYSNQLARSVKFVADKILENENASEKEKICATRVLEIYKRIGDDILINAANLFEKFNGEYESSPLQNTYHRLKVDKKLNVAYLGGSVTSGVGLSSADQNTKSWRGLTTAWLRESFPSATIRETNAAIGGTGSVFGAYRAMDDLKLTDEEYKPDLLFVEFAINDKYDSPSDPADYVSDVKAYMETIVRTVRKYSPYCDIIFCFTTDKDMLATEYPTLKAHMAVANTYGIPTISLGARLVTEESLTHSNWNTSGFFDSWKQADGSMYYDIVHPSAAGYAKYGSYVIEYLHDEFFGKAIDPKLYSAQAMPAASHGALDSPERYFFNDAKGKTSGFNLTEDNGLSSKGYLTAGSTGAKVSFTFTGTGLQLWTYAKKEAATVKVTVDGVSKTYNIQRNSANHKAYRVASDLELKEHTVTIEVVSVSSSYPFELRALMVEGDPNFEGVTFKSVN